MKYVSESPKKFVISSEIYHQRLNQFFTSNDSVAEAHVIMGVDAQKAKNDEVVLQSLKDQSSEESMWPLGSICCGLAHYQVFQECIELDKPVTIFEDDAILVSDFDAKSKILMEQIGTEWDIIQWGFNWDSFLYIRFPEKKGPVFKVHLQAEKDKFSIEDFKNTGEQSTLFPLVSTFGMHAYTISPKGAKKFLEFYPRITDIYVNNVDLLGQGYWALSLDMVLNAFYDTRDCFIALPPLSYVVNDKQVSAIWNPATESDTP